MWDRAALVAGAAACAGIAFGPLTLQALSLVVAVAVLAYRPSVALPPLVARGLLVIGQASFAIFLLHVIFLRVYQHVLGLHDPDGAWLFATAASTLAWVAFSAAQRSFRHELNER